MRERVLNVLEAPEYPFASINAVATVITVPMAPVGADSKIVQTGDNRTKLLRLVLYVPRSLPCGTPASLGLALNIGLYIRHTCEQIEDPL